VNASRDEPDAPVLKPAVPQLLLLAEVCRPDWDCNVLADAITAAEIAGWSWDRILAETVRLIRSPEGSPWDLKRAAADPLKREEPAPKGRPRNPEYLAARAAIEAMDPLPEHRGHSAA